MGEYARRKSDGVEIKIGTCETMYYIRFEDRDKVTAVPNSIDLSNPAHVDGLRFRLPFPDEDNVPIGQYEPFERGLRLYREVACTWCDGSGMSHRTTDKCQRCHGEGTYGIENYAPADLIDHPGTMHFRHEAAGMQLCVPCYHGMKLPAPEKFEKGTISAAWNGKGYAFELAHLKAIRDGSMFRILPVTRCRFCGDEWRCDWSDIAEYLPKEWRFLLDRYATQTYNFGSWFVPMDVQKLHM